MQAALHLPSLSFLPLQSSKTTSIIFSKPRPLVPIITKHSPATTPKSLQHKVKALAPDTQEIDYNSMTSSVFPAEACDTIGGAACDIEMGPETKLQPEPRPSTPTLEAVDREYLQYTDPKTVFPGEACDDLGGEFCEPDYQAGIHQTK